MPNLAAHDGKLPKVEAEKLEFNAFVLNSGKHYQHASNFQEAAGFAFHCYAPYEINYETREVLNDEKANNITSESHWFWVLTRAVKEFQKKEGGGIYLPISGSLPDMTTTAHSYVQLQRIYGAKAAQDADAVEVHARALLKSIGRPEDSITKEQIAFFCKNCRDMRVFRLAPLSNEFDNSKIQKDNNWYDEKGKWFLANLAAGKFQTEHGRLPGDRNTEPLQDFDALKKISQTVIKELEFDDDVLPDDYLKEMCRYGGSQIHTTCAYLGGVASQEIIKLITKQWVGVNNSLIYDGISGNAGVFTI